MYKRISAFVVPVTLSLLVAAALAGLYAPPAQAVPASVRIEGKTRTLFGATNPRIEAGSTALDALVTVANRSELYYHLATSSFGSYIDQIGLYPAAGSAGWVFKVNGMLPPVGADAVTLKPGDRVLWYWADFDPVTYAGPKTLLLRRSKLTRLEKSKVKRTKKKRYCYSVVAEDDKGVVEPASGAQLHLRGSKIVGALNGRVCIGPHKGYVWASLDGAVRSNALK